MSRRREQERVVGAGGRRTNRVWIVVWLILIEVFGGELRAAASMPWIRLGPDGVSFVEGTTGHRFVVWGVNYDHDVEGRLIEEYWEREWGTVESDFREMKELGANVVRIHLQLGRFLASPTRLDRRAFGRLGRLLRLAERTGLYLDLTGLGCYHKRDVPGWYDALGETERWAVQARFWGGVARVCKRSPAVFCYDLMNEPILPGERPETEWLAGEFGGKHFVQRISLDLAGRTREAVARAWVDRMVNAIRREDRRHLVTVGVIPWAQVFPGAKPLFNGPEVGRNLDFVSVHFYPEQGRIEEALKALAVYEVGKPLVVEEMFPLKCGIEALGEFVERSRGFVDGWMGFYWGRPIADYDREKGGVAEAMTRGWLEYFRRQAPGMRLGE